MSRSSLVLTCVLAVASLAGGPASQARRTVAPQAAKFSREWFLVRLASPIPDEVLGKSPVPHTGRAALDAAIAQQHVLKIERALRVSGRSPRFPEIFKNRGLDRIYKFRVPGNRDIEKMIERFAGLHEVESAEPDYIGQGGALVPNDPLFSSQWGFDQISDADVDAPEAWGLATGSKAVIAVLDTGLDMTHEEFAGKFLPGYDFVNVDADPTDDYGHGTNVSSIASAGTNNGKGVAGSCWNCLIMPLKVLDNTNSGFYSWWADAMVWATDHGAQVINLSAGGFSTSSVLLAGVQYAYDAGVIHVSITHNDNLHLIRYPGNYREPITVGATNSLDQRAAPLCFSPTSGSNYGGRTDVVAPGDLILGAAMGGGYESWCGTSQAAPLVTGLVGIMESVNPSLGREEARHLIQSGADDQVGRPTEDTPGFDIYHGWGRVNMLRTLLGTQASMTLRVEGGAATRVSYGTANPLAASYDFIRGDLGALRESAAGVDTGPVVCLENDSADPDTAGNEDVGTPAIGHGFFYLGRFNAAGPGSYGGSTRHRDRVPTSGDCPGCGNLVAESTELCDGGDIGGATCTSQGFAAGVLACGTSCQAFDTSGCSICGNGICEPRGGLIKRLGGLDHVSKGLVILPPTRRVISISRDDNLLREIKVSTGTTVGSVPLTLAGKTITGGNGLSLDPISGRLFGVVKLNGQAGRELVTIDPATGACTDIGNTGDNFAGIAFTSTGDLYAVTGDGATVPRTLYRLSTTTGAPTFVLTLGGVSAGESIGYNPDDGLLYRASGFGTQNIDEILQKIGPSTLTVTNVTLKGDDYSEAIALVYEGAGVFLVADVDAELYRMVADGEDCLSCPQDCNGVQSGDPGSLYCCGDGDGVSPVTCQDARCTANGMTCH